MKLFYVYQIQSINYPEKIYSGFSENINQRLKRYNKGRNQYTKPFAPWQLVTLICFTNQDKAKSFELYLKTGSGRAFSKRHF